MSLKNLRVLITAGPTREFFDPVRFLSNPSSGKMGYALAEAALKRGAKVVLVTGPVSLKAPACRVIRVISAKEMYRASVREALRADLVLMTAAVSDYRPATYSKKKMKKSDKPQALKLVRTKDILKELGRRKRRGQVLVGFAAETHSLNAYARKKLKEKNLDAIVANLVGRPGAGFESDFNRASLIDASGRTVDLPGMTKTAMARRILDFVSYSLVRNPVFACQHRMTPSVRRH
jgi:phosphopantothenoylcysteine decarboxylase/phosphopantothenate--cysteine ligase